MHTGHIKHMRRLHAAHVLINPALDEGECSASQYSSYPQRKDSQYPLDRRPQSQSEHYNEKKNSAPAGN
jgi:hypothetical protein